MPEDIENLERRVNAVLYLNLILCFARMSTISRSISFILHTSERNSTSVGVGDVEGQEVDLKLEVAVIAPSFYYCCRAFYYNCVAKDLRNGAYHQDAEACKRWISSLIGFYIFLIVGPILHCAVVGVPLVQYLQDEFGKNWLPWLILASGDWFMIRIMSKYAKEVLGQQGPLGDPPPLLEILRADLWHGFME